VLMTHRPNPGTPQPGRRQVLRWMGGVVGAIGVGAVARLFNPSRSGTTPTTRVEAASATTSTPSTTARPIGPTTAIGPVPTTTTQPPPSATTTQPPPSTTSTTQPPASTTTTPTTQPPVVSAGGTSAIAVISKTGWGAKPAGPLGSHTPVRITYHHSAVAGAKVSGAPARIRGYQAYHLDQGWPDIAYHFLIDQAGRIYQGRNPDAPGDTFTEYDPTGHFLVCFDGNFDSETASAESVEALVKMLAWGCQRYGIDPATLGGHRDYAATTCPGKNLYALKAVIAQKLGEVLDSGTRYQLVFSDTPV